MPAVRPLTQQIGLAPRLLLVRLPGLEGGAESEPSKGEGTRTRQSLAVTCGPSLRTWAAALRSTPRLCSTRGVPEESSHPARFGAVESFETDG
jgi:hypothetical protein